MAKPKTKNRRLNRLNLRFNKLIAFVVVFAAVASLAVLAIHAASPNASTEPENASVSAPAVAGSDSSASNNQYVQFKQAGVDPRCATGGTYLWSNLAACGWPGATNTGPDMSQCPGGLTNVGTNNTATTITVTTANTVINCQNVTGRILINAQNVTVKNSKVTWDGGGVSGKGAIEISEGASATVDHVDINGLNHTHICVFDVGVKGSTLPYSMVAKFINCHGVNDGIFSWWWTQSVNAGAGADFVVQDNYLHDFTQNAANGHIDGYQTEGTTNGTITHNTFQMNEVANDVQIAGGGMDSAIALWNDYNNGSTPVGKNTSNINIGNNLFGGGAAVIYAEDRSPGDGSPGNPTPVGGNETTNIHITNNKFSTIYYPCVGQFMVWFYRGPGESSSLIWPPYYGGPTDGWNQGGSNRSGNNLLETGENVDNGNPHHSGLLCT
jgi:hypothetical protein